MIPGYLAGTLAVLATDGVIGAGILGIGLMIRRGYGLRALSVDDVFKSFWLGFSALLLLLILWNFALPVTGLTLAFALGLGFAGLLLSGRELRDLMQRSRPSRGFLVVIALTALWVANLATGPLSNWDSALYHQQNVRWAETYPAVPGIVNVYGPLALNNSSFLFAAMLDTGPWEGGSFHLVNGLLVLVLLVQILVSARRVGRREAGFQPYDIFMVLLAAAVVNLTGGERLSSFDTDVPMTVLLLATGAVIWDLLRSGGGGKERRGFDLLVVTAALCAAVTLKLSAAVFAAVCVLLLGWSWLRAGYGIRGRGPALACGAALAFGVAYAVRGIILSGYVLYPSTILAAPVEWRAPQEHPMAEVAYVIYCALEFSWSYSLRWARHLLAVPFYVVVPTVLTCVGLVLVLSLRARNRQRTGRGASWILLLPAGIAAAAWLASAPDPRYMTAVFWLAAAVAGTEAVLLSTGGPGAAPGRTRLLAAIAFLGLAPLWVNPILLQLRSAKPFNPVMAVLRYNLQKPPPGSWLKGSQGRPRFRTFVTDSGLSLNVPERLCWDLPLPCTPNPAPNLRLRRPGDITAGFMVDGGWQMQSWPQAWRADFLPEWRARRRADE